jgi:hypothetical protein
MEGGECCVYMCDMAGAMCFGTWTAHGFHQRLHPCMTAEVCVLQRLWFERDGGVQTLWVLIAGVWCVSHHTLEASSLWGLAAVGADACLACEQQQTDKLLFDDVCA